MTSGLRVSSRWLALLLVAGVVEAALALVLRLEDVHRLVGGEATLETVLAAVGLGWLIVLLLAMAGVSRTVYAARRSLAISETAVADVASTSRDWVWEADRDLRLTYCSPRVADQLGYSAEDLLGVAMPTLMTPDSEAEARRIASEAVASGRGWHDVELDWRHADGHVVTLQGSAEPIIDPQGQVVGFRGSRRLVTEAMTVERAIIAARSRIQTTVAERAIDTALQPIVDVTTGRLCGTEALARFRDGRGPDQWFADARECGSSLDLDRLAFDTGAQVIGALPADAYLSINATPELILDERWRETLLTGDFPLERLVVEITEHVEISSYDALNAALLPLRERGVRLAIDDTGAGYASFSHVLQLRPDIIKIDRSLIGYLADDPARRSLVTALVLLALDLGAALTAEGVETAAELHALTTLGVDNAQGYFLGKPTTDRRHWNTWTGKTWTTRTSSTSPSNTGTR